MASPIGSPARGSNEVFPISVAELMRSRREFASDQSDFLLHPYGPSLAGDEQEGIITPEMLDSVLGVAQYVDEEYGYPGTGRVYAYDVYAPYKELERDTKICAALEQRITTAVEHPWHVEPGGTDDIDIRAADMVREHLEALDSPSPIVADYALIEEMDSYDQLEASFADALLMGFAAGEIIWTPEGRKGARPGQIKMKGQHRFKAYLGEDGWQPRLLTRTNQTYGTPLPPRKFLFYRHRPKRGPFGEGLGHQLFFPALYKRKTLEYFLIHGQRYASPTAFIEVPRGSSAEVVESAKYAASQVGIEAAIAIPEGTGITPFEGKVGNNSTYRELLKYLDGQISQIIIGQTGTLDQSGDSGSRAQDEVADLQTLRKAKRDAQNFAAYLRRTLIAWDVEHNLPGAKLPWIVREFPELDETEDMVEMATRDEKIVSFTGRRLESDFVEERHQVKLGDPIAPGQPVTGALGARGDGDSLELAEQDSAEEVASRTIKKLIKNPVDLAESGTLERPNFSSEQEWAELAITQMTSTLADLKAAVRSIVERSSSLEELSSAFENLLISSSHAEDLSSAIAPALTVAYGVGLSDIEEEAAENAIALAEGVSPVMGFDAAIDALTAKLPVPTERWGELKGEDQAWAFTVAGVAQMDALQSIQNAVARTLDGGTYKEFVSSFEEAYENAGLDPVEPWRMRLVMQQNVTNSYQAGRYDRSQDAEFQRVAPYRTYRHGDSDEPRLHHKALDGYTALASDPIWQKIYPPGGFGCNCRVFSLTAGQVERRDLSIRGPLEGSDVPVIRTEEGELRAVADEGFRGPPSRVASREKALEAMRSRFDGSFMQTVLDEWFAAEGVVGETEGEIEEETEEPIPSPEPEQLVDPYTAFDVLDSAERDNPEVYNALALETFSQELKLIDSAEDYAKAIAEIDRLQDEYLDNYLATAPLEEQFSRTKPQYFSDAMDEFRRQKTEVLERQAAAQEAAGGDPFERIYNRLSDRVASRAEGGEQVREMLGRVGIADNIPSEEVPGIAAAVERAYRVMGGRVDLQTLILTKPRAFAQIRQRAINVGREKNQAATDSTMFHEMAHLFEVQNGLGRAAEGWRDSKAEDTSRLYKLNDLEKSGGFDDSELARKGDYLDPYVGKVYVGASFPDNAGGGTPITEVIAMGVERFSSTRAMAEFAEEDRDHFLFVLGTLASVGRVAD